MIAVVRETVRSLLAKLADFCISCMSLLVFAFLDLLDQVLCPVFAFLDRLMDENTLQRRAIAFKHGLQTLDLGLSHLGFIQTQWLGKAKHPTHVITGINQGLSNRGENPNIGHIPSRFVKPTILISWNPCLQSL